MPLVYQFLYTVWVPLISGLILCLTFCNYPPYLSIQGFPGHTLWRQVAYSCMPGGCLVVRQRQAQLASGSQQEDEVQGLKSKIIKHLSQADTLVLKLGFIVFI